MFYFGLFFGQYSYERIYDQIPQLIRSYDWTNYWTASKGRLLGNLTKDLNDEQLFAINSTLSLDSIKKHPECPTNEVLLDPDATDGWIISENGNEKENLSYKRLKVLWVRVKMLVKFTSWLVKNRQQKIYMI